MAEHSPLTTRLIADGLAHQGPTRTLRDLLAEHHALVAFAASVRDAPAAPNLIRMAATLLVERCEATNAQEKAA